MKKVLKNIGLFLALFTSVSSLLCCALPTLFVAMGAGAVFASLTSQFPHLIWVSTNKIPIFIIAGFLLFVSRLFDLKPTPSACDPQKNSPCSSSKQWRRWVWRLSLLFYGVALFFAFVLPEIG